MVGSARESAGGVSSVIKLIEKMPVWKKYSCYWLGTQIQRNYAWKLWYAIKGNVIAAITLWRYDIVHLHTTPDKLGLLIQLPILLLAKLFGKKVILHLHVGNQLKSKKNGLFVFCLKRADLIILLAKKWQQLFNEYYPEVNTPTTVLYNACADIPPFDFNRKEKIIMMAAWYNDNKAPDVLLKAIKILLTQNRSQLEGWRVMLLGNGEIERFKAMSDEMGLSDIVTFTGYLTGSTREEVFRKASIYCMCSYEEGFPMVVLESWMYGINLITTPVGGLPDVIEEEKNCLTFDFGDNKGLAKQLSILMNDEVLREKMADYSRQFAIERFAIEKINDCLEDIYQNILG